MTPIRSSFWGLGLLVILIVSTNCGGESSNTVPTAVEVQTPDIVGLTQAAAGAALRAVGLSVGRVAEEESDVVPVGQVIRQAPVAGAEVAVGTSVDFVLSTGPQSSNVVVPDVGSLTRSAAEATLSDVGLSVGRVTEEASEGVPAGQVIRQAPLAGTTVATGTAVDLVISTGPALVTVPDVRSLTRSAAEGTLNGVGLSVGDVAQEASESVPAGRVIRQTPPAGAVVETGTRVDLVISTGPESSDVTVPDVGSLTRSEAETALSGVGLVLGVVTEEASVSVLAGRVIRQAPSAGVTVASGSAVDLVISTGPPPVVVPDVRSLTRSAAEDALSDVGLVIGTVTEEASASVPAGQVIRQTPAAGASVAPGSAVNLVISTGPATSGFSDEFNSDRLSDWTLRHEVEGTSAQYTVLDVDVTTPGSLTIIPLQTPGWFADGDAPLIFKMLTGNFAVHTAVRAESVGSPGQAPASNFNSAGLMARDPSGRNGPENYIMLNVGTQNSRIPGRVGSETKTTEDSESELFLDAGSNRGELVLCRVGDQFISFRFLEGDAGWAETNRFTRSDLPSTLQVGMVVNAFQAPADIRATFDFIRLLPTPSAPSACTPR